MSSLGPVEAPSPLRSGARLLVVCLAVSLALNVAQTIFSPLLSTLRIERMLLAFKVINVVFIALGVFTVVAWVKLLRAAAQSSSTTLLRATVLLGAATLLFSCIGFVPLLDHPYTIMVIASVLGLASTVVGWLSLDGLVRAYEGPPSSALPVLVVVTAVRLLAFAALTYLQQIHELFARARLYGGIIGVGTLAFVASTTILLLRARAVAALSQNSSDQHAASLPRDSARANADLVWGGVWAVGGLAVTGVSYALAGSGGHFVVTTGAIVFGTARMIRGLTRG